MSQTEDAQVIQSALSAHREYLRTAEEAHRRAARALSGRGELPSDSSSPITLSAAHRARCASFAQRGEFVEQLIAFPAAGLRALTAQDMRTLQVPAHIGTAAVPPEVAARITAREESARRSAAGSAARPSAAAAPGTAPSQAPGSHLGGSPAGASSAADSLADQEIASPVPPQPKPAWHRRSFEEVLYGHWPDDEPPTQ
ncbi:hypothetical protein [Nesterenkonia sp.]|uniref:hypothetical protein n=1 Tax=Nesterenkonia sp. TaxID=704201 RepID=UPI00260F3B41|nr:hypothetical protein [Nesterenkonia sp.]